jgi:L-lactate dehydrogenase (cytochrome)
VLVPSSDIDISTRLLGNKFSSPFFIAPAGGGKFSHRSGEVLWTEAAARHGILQWACSNAGSTLKEMGDARAHGQILYWQIYASKNLEDTAKQVERAVAAGYQGFALTVDAVQVGKRERDVRFTIAESQSEDNEDNDSRMNSVSVSRP